MTTTLSSAQLAGAPTSSGADQLPDALLALTPDQMRAMLARMQTIARLRRGAALRADAQARVVRRSAASLAGEFFERKHAESPISAPPLAGTPDPAQIAAELERIRAGNVAALLAKAPPTSGAWAKAKLPRTGWALLRIEDTGQVGGACCELCERAQMRFGYVMRHAEWPANAPADTYACRLCAAHLLGRAPTEPKSRRKKAEDRPTWVDGPNGHRVRNGKLRPDFKGRRLRDVMPVALPDV